MSLRVAPDMSRVSRCRTQFLAQYPLQTVGARIHQELWIPSEDLAELNRNIVGLIEVIAEFGPEQAR
jgi:hypothetical protein